MVSATVVVAVQGFVRVYRDIRYGECTGQFFGSTSFVTQCGVERAWTGSGDLLVLEPLYPSLSDHAPHSRSRRDSIEKVATLHVPLWNLLRQVISTPNQVRGAILARIVCTSLSLLRKGGAQSGIPSEGLLLLSLAGPREWPVCCPGQSVSVNLTEDYNCGINGAGKVD